MKTPLLLLTSASLLLFASCASRTAFTPGGPTTVGMPEKLSDRERTFIPEIDTALRQQGLVPVRHGKGDLQLDFEMSAGPINIDTRIAMSEDKAVLFTANGRAGGIPLLGRDGVARKSFDEAFAEFQEGLYRTANSRGWSSASSTSGIPTSDATHDELPVY